MSRVGWATVAGRIREVLAVDVAQDVGKISVPILYLQGKRDALVHDSSAREIQRHAGRFQLVTMDAPHVLLQVAPREAAGELTRFVESLRLG